MGLVCAVLFGFLVGSVALYLMLVIAVFSYHQLRTSKDPLVD